MFRTPLPRPHQIISGYAIVDAMRFIYATLFSLLAACAPATDCIPDTAFTAKVVSAQPLEVRSERGGTLLVAASEETRVMSKGGAALTLGDLAAGNTVYIRGSLEGRNVTALEVRLLKR